MQNPPNKADHEKSRVNLGIDSQVLERAKVAGINISARTEELLRALTYEPKGNIKEDVARAYGSLFESMQPIIGKYHTTIEVGKITDKDYSSSKRTSIDLRGCPIILHSVTLSTLIDGRHYIGLDEFEHVWLLDELDYLYEPRTILRNFILAITTAAERNKEKIKELDLALRFVRALFEDNTDNNETKEENGSPKEN